MRNLHQHDHKPKYRQKQLDAFAKGKHFVLEPVDVQIHDVDSDNIGVGCGQPSARGGTRNTSPSRVPDVARRPDEISKPMVMPLLNARLGNHAAMIATTDGTASADYAMPTLVYEPLFASPAQRLLASQMTKTRAGNSRMSVRRGKSSNSSRCESCPAN